MDGSAVGLAAAIRAGELSAVDAVTAAIERIDRLDPTIGAVVTPLFERALEHAPKAVGPFAGVPMLLKDAGQELEGTPHFVGLAALRDAGHVSPGTTALAARFEELGFVIVGRSNVPELSSGVTTEPAGFAPTRNPYDRGRTAGGSSGGSAAAVAAGLVPIAHGSDGTGSLRFPASACGLLTICPTATRIPAHPPAGQPNGLDVWREFVLTRDVADLSALFDLLAVPATPAPSGPLRVGLLASDPLLGIPLEEPCADAVRVAGGLLESMGHVVEPVWPSELDGFPARIAAPITVLVGAGRAIQVAWVERRLGRDLREEDLAPGVLDSARRGATTSAEDVAAAEDAVRAAVAGIPRWWDDHDVLVTPTMRREPWPLGEQAGPLHCGMFEAPFSFAGQPSLNAPVHVSARGLPVGVQLVARRGGDATLLRLARELEAVTGWHHRRPG